MSILLHFHNLKRKRRDKENMAPFRMTLFMSPGLLLDLEQYVTQQK